MPRVPFVVSCRRLETANQIMLLSKTLPPVGTALRPIQIQILLLHGVWFVLRFEDVCLMCFHL
jgi:hypothetical protein